MLGFNIRRSELAGFIAGKKDDTSGFFGITFKHKALLPEPLENARFAEACNPS
jgi:hypothetical protein